MRACKLIIDNAIVDSVNNRWAASVTGKMFRKIWPRLDEERTISLLKLQGGVLSVVVCLYALHCIMGTHARCIGLGHLANNFCRSCSDGEQEVTVPHLLGTCPELCQRKIKYMGTYYVDDLEELSGIDIGSLNRFIGSSEWF